MKRCLAALLLVLLLAGCGVPSISLEPVSGPESAGSGTEEPQAAAPVVDDGVMLIDEPFMDAQCRDILTYPEDYAGVVIRIEGMYHAWEDEFAQLTRHAVTRYCPDGCCGPGLTGLEIYYDGECPEENAWVEATGTIELIHLGEYPLPFPLLRLTSLVEKEERGNEYVAN